MRTLIVIFTLAFAVNSNANLDLSCVTEEGHLVKYVAKYGELTEMDQQGNLLLDFDDGYDTQLLNLETFPVQTSYTIWHHEEPDVTILSVGKIGEDYATPFTGTYLNTNGEKVQITCL